MKILSYMIGWFLFAGFIAIKIAGISFAAWSWWWLLMPAIPILSLAVKHYGL